MKVTIKDKIFMKKFVRLYFKRRELDFIQEKYRKTEKHKNRTKALDEKIIKLLPQYPRLFDNDLRILYDILKKTGEKEKATFIVNDFKTFLRWTVDKLYTQKLISKKEYNYLEEIISKINLKIRNLAWPIVP